MSELAMNTDGFTIVSGSSRLRCVEVSKEAVASASIDSCAKLSHPLSVARVKSHPLVPRSVVNALAPIRGVLLNRSNSQIRPSIIERISGLYVVNLFFWSHAHNLAVHSDTSGFSFGARHSDCVVSFGVGVPMSEPIPLHEPLVIGSVNRGVKSFGKWNEFNGLILRLLDSMTFNSYFHSAIVAL